MAGAGNSAVSLWAFSLDHYARMGVRESVLALQDRRGADVNLLFFCLWCAATGRRCDPAALAVADEGVARWRDQITGPLRRLRDHVKAEPELARLEGAMDVRARILEAELESERVAQMRIESAAPPPDAPPKGPIAETAGRNLRAYLAYLGAPVDARVEDDLQTLVQAVFSA